MELKELQISVTNKCLVGCKYCYKDKTNETFISIEHINRIISLSKKLGIKVLRLTGGDVFQHPLLLDILKIINENHLEVILNISIKRIKELVNVRQYCNYVLFSFQNISDFDNYSEELNELINKNPQIEFMGCMVFENYLLEAIDSLLGKISSIDFYNFFFLRDISAQDSSYYLGLLQLVKKISNFNRANKLLNSPIKVANSFPLCHVRKEDLNYCDGCNNDDGNSFVYIDEKGNLKLNSYSGDILANVADLDEIKFIENIKRAKKMKEEAVGSDEKCFNCKIKDKCQGGISFNKEFSRDKLLGFRDKHLGKFSNFSKLQTEIMKHFWDHYFNVGFEGLYFRNSDFFMYYPNPDKWTENKNHFDFMNSLTNCSGDFNLYIHIPFCNCRCNFCGVKKYPNKLIESYVNFLLSEIDKYCEILKNNNFKNIYIGGGTPTIIGKDNFKRLFDKLFCYIDKENINEITIEVFPKDFDKELFDYLQEHVTRVSIGIQCFNEETLKESNRNLYILEMKEFLGNLADYKFIKNFDIIYGLYLKNEEIYFKDLNDILSYNPENITYQALHNSKGITDCDEIFFQDYLKRLIKLNSDGRSLLDKYGYVQYSGEDFVKNGNPKFLYQLDFLNNTNLFAIGIDSVSFLNNEYFLNKGKTGFNYYKLDDYELFIHELSSKIKLLKIDLDKINNKAEDYLLIFSESIDYLIKNNLIIAEDKNIKITKKGLCYVDLISEILSLNNFDYKRK